jgi:beta-1,4-mannosyltransferase
MLTCSSQKPCGTFSSKSGISSAYDSRRFPPPASLTPGRGHKVILHDRPPSHFHRATCQEIHEVIVKPLSPLSTFRPCMILSQLFLKYEPVLTVQPHMDKFLPKTFEPYSTILTQTIPKSTDTTTQDSTPSSLSSLSTYAELPAPKLRPDRPALLVSSTSWTPDEDFGILLDALKVYEARANELSASGAAETLPKLLVMVTGKGPLQSRYMAEVWTLHESWKWVRLVSLWLKAEDYPVLLGMFCLVFFL